MYFIIYVTELLIVIKLQAIVATAVSDIMPGTAYVLRFSKGF